MKKKYRIVLETGYRDRDHMIYEGERITVERKVMFGIWFTLLNPSTDEEEFRSIESAKEAIDKDIRERAAPYIRQFIYYP